MLFLNSKTFLKLQIAHWTQIVSTYFIVTATLHTYLGFFLKINGFPCFRKFIFSAFWSAQELMFSTHRNSSSSPGCAFTTPGWASTIPGWAFTSPGWAFRGALVSIYSAVMILRGALRGEGSSVITPLSVRIRGEGRWCVNVKFNPNTHSPLSIQGLGLKTWS